MRITISVDSADTDTVRRLAAAVSTSGAHDILHPGRHQLRVHCDGPERWAAITPPLNPAQFEFVVERLAPSLETAVCDDIVDAIT